MVRLFNHWFPTNTVLQVVFDAVLLFGSAMLVLLWLSRGDLESLDLLWPPALLFAVAMVVVNAVLGLYQRRVQRTKGQTTARLLVSLVLTVPVAYVAFHLWPLKNVPHEALKLTALAALGAVVAVRGIASHSRAEPMMTRRVLVVGTGAEAISVEQTLNQLGPGLKIIGFFPVNSIDEILVPGDRIVGTGEQLAETARRHNVDEVVVAVKERRGGVLPLRELLDCKLAGIKVLDLSSYFERSMGQLRIDSLHASWLIFGEGFRQGVVRTVVKRAFDLVTALILLTMAAPVMLLTALAIIFETGFPVLYRQERVGQGGRVFNVIKFRSMRLDAEGDGKPRWATTNDDRVTRVGRFIRKLRIDELPQLFDVLNGNMSMVGPRPERPYFVDQLSRQIRFYAARHSVKPGITGWAQVRYQYGATVDDAVQKLQYDLYYVKNHTLFLDIVVLIETVGVVLSGEGSR
ncbi:MAG: TIGR03013 family PEP-CTERM/XrtA system glycosyltransferase [Betaproteobacteria bacterium]|nr:TIGR03013 family PEP-CTERM/XrtA system glycosyltransferase [Betaproteobacteria bacterium]